MLNIKQNISGENDNTYKVAVNLKFSDLMIQGTKINKQPCQYKIRLMIKQQRYQNQSNSYKFSQMIPHKVERKRKILICLVVATPQAKEQTKFLGEKQLQTYPSTFNSIGILVFGCPTPLLFKVKLLFLFYLYPLKFIFNVLLKNFNFLKLKKNKYETALRK